MPSNFSLTHQPETDCPGFQVETSIRGRDRETDGAGTEGGCVKAGGGTTGSSNRTLPGSKYLADITTSTQSTRVRESTAGSSCGTSGGHSAGQLLQLLNLLTERLHGSFSLGGFLPKL